MRVRMASVSRGRAVRAAVILAAFAGLASSVVPASAGSTGARRSFTAPFKVGPSGGDSFSYHSASTDGSVTVARVYPIPGVINCTKGAPYAKLDVLDRARKPIRKVVVSYDSAAVDNFTFAMVSLRDVTHNRWYGTTTDRGFVAGSGTITLRPDQPQGGFPKPLTIEFGLQQSSACPSADAGSIRFTKVEVFS